MAGGDKPGANSRGRGGKFRKFTRGGGKHFSRDLKPLDADGNEINMWSKDGRKKADDSSSDEDSSSEEEDSDEEDSDDSDAPKASGALSREEKRAEKKAKKDAAIRKAKGQAVQVGDLPPSDDEESDDDDDMPSNPNHSKASRNQTKAPVANKAVDEAAAGVAKMKVAAPANRKERESMEAALAKERYRKMHEAGKTDEAKADMARLKLIREKRQAEAERKQAEKEEKDEQESARKAEIDAKEAKKREAAMGPSKAKKGKK